jgi:hypothetical protein
MLKDRIKYIHNIFYNKEKMCFILNLKLFFYLKGFLLSDAILSIIVSYMGFYFTPDNIITKENIHGRNGSFWDMFKRLCQRINADLIKYQYTSFNDFLSGINGLIKNKDYPLIWINLKYIKRSLYFDINDYWTLVIILSVNRNNILYFDNGIKSILKKDFFMSISKRYNFSIYDFDLLGKDTLEFNTQECMNNLISQLSSEGIYAMINFYAFVKNCRDEGELFNFYYQLSRPGGLFTSRLLMSEFLLEISEIGLSNHYNKIADKWKIVSALLLKLSIVNSPEVRKRIVNRLEWLIQAERKGISELSFCTYKKIEVMK